MGNRIITSPIRNNAEDNKSGASVIIGAPNKADADEDNDDGDFPKRNSTPMVSRNTPTLEERRLTLITAPPIIRHSQPNTTTATTDANTIVTDHQVVEITSRENTTDGTEIPERDR